MRINKTGKHRTEEVMSITVFVQHAYKKTVCI